jgi:hypothetical protein
MQRSACRALATLVLVVSGVSTAAGWPPSGAGIGATGDIAFFRGHPEAF